MSSGTSDTTGSRFVFLLGTGRCGSSLLQELLSRHPDVGFLSNIDDRLGSAAASRWNADLYRRVPVSLTEKGRLRFAPSEGYRILEREVSPAVVAPVRDLVADDATPWLAERFRRFFVDRAARQGRPVFLHKFTGWPRAGFIDAALPGTRFIHLIRDGRAVANSLLQMPWWRGYAGPDAWGWGPLPEEDRSAWEKSGRSFPVLAALEWRLLMRAFDDAKAAVDADRWIDVRYEDLVADPKSRTEELLGFIGLPWTPPFERSFDRYRVSGSRREAFREELSGRDVEAIEAVLADDLRRFGYPVDGGPSANPS